jgi:hypothetical protein
MYNTHTPHNTHTHDCGCTQSNINTDTNATGEERDRNNIDTTSGITTDKELGTFGHTTRCSQTNEIRKERDQNNTIDGITAVRDFRDIFPFHDRFLQQLGDRHRWVLYHVNFSDSPDQQFDAACDKTWVKEVGPQEMTRLNKEFTSFSRRPFRTLRPPAPSFGVIGSSTR